MKAISFLLCITCVIVTFSFAMAFQNEPDGFRGVKWGTRIEELKDMTFTEKGVDTDLYIRNADKKLIGDAEVMTIKYVFKDGAFIMAYGIST